MPVSRKQEPIHIRGCCPAWAEIMSWQTEMHRLKQTLWLIEDSKREAEKIKSKGLLTRLINEITLCCLGAEARGMAQRASTDETVDLSGNKEPSHWWASKKGSRRLGLTVPLKELEFKSSVQKGALEPTFHGILPWVLPLAINCRELFTNSALTSKGELELSSAFCPAALVWVHLLQGEPFRNSADKNSSV